MGRERCSRMNTSPSLAHAHAHNALLLTCGEVMACPFPLAPMTTQVEPGSLPAWAGLAALCATTGSVAGAVEANEKVVSEARGGSKGIAGRHRVRWRKGGWPFPSLSPTAPPSLLLPPSVAALPAARRGPVAHAARAVAGRRLPPRGAARRGGAPVPPAAPAHGGGGAAPGEALHRTWSPCMGVAQPPLQRPCAVPAAPPRQSQQHACCTSAATPPAPLRQPTASDAHAGLPLGKDPPHTHTPHPTNPTPPAPQPLVPGPRAQRISALRCSASWQTSS